MEVNKPIAPASPPGLSTANNHTQKHHHLHSQSHSHSYHHGIFPSTSILILIKSIIFIILLFAIILIIVLLRRLKSAKNNGVLLPIILPVLKKKKTWKKWFHQVYLSLNMSNYLITIPMDRLCVNPNFQNPPNTGILKLKKKKKNQ